MSGAHLRDRFDSLLVDEPPLAMSIDPVLATGSRLRRRRRLSYAAGSLATVAAVTAAVTVSLSLTDHETQHISTATPATTTLTAATPKTADTGLTAEQQRVAAAIRAASPQGWTFDMAADRWSGQNLEGTANDGNGDGRLLVRWSRDAGYFPLHPCRDPQYVQGATCTEQAEPDGAVLSMRGVVDTDGSRDIAVTLTYPDGSGLVAKSGNYTLSLPMPTKTERPTDKTSVLAITRSQPTYTINQLAHVAVAVDRALSLH